MRRTFCGTITLNNLMPRCWHSRATFLGIVSRRKERSAALKGQRVVSPVIQKIIDKRRCAEHTGATLLLSSARHASGVKISNNTLRAPIRMVPLRHAESPLHDQVAQAYKDILPGQIQPRAISPLTGEILLCVSITPFGRPSVPEVNRPRLIHRRGPLSPWLEEYCRHNLT